MGAQSHLAPTGLVKESFLEGVSLKRIIRGKLFQEKVISGAGKATCGCKDTGYGRSGR